MTELQRVEFDILKEFVRVCNENGLKYFLVCGSALGSVKYGGFIPWDDDIDVALPRDDYNRFVKLAPSQLADELFLQTYETDEEYPNLYAKLRNSDTAYIEKSSANLCINHGIYIDVFPLDGYPEAKLSQFRLEFRKKLFKLKQSCSFEGNYSLKVRILRLVLRLLGTHKRTKQNVRSFERLISKYPVENSKIWCNHGNWQGRREYAPRAQYGNGTESVFEGLKVRVPEQYDEYLTQKYGDWKNDLPEEEKQGHHYFTVCDTERSYKSYIG